MHTTEAPGTVFSQSAIDATSATATIPPTDVQPNSAEPYDID